MTEKNTTITTENPANEEAYREDASHHHHSHHHSHHSHSHHHSYHHSSHTGSSGRSSSRGFSLTGFLKEKSQSRNNRQLPRYRVVSQRILFCMVLLFFVFWAISGMLREETEQVNPAASTTRSESDQLKVQITILQMENEALKEKLQKYEILYGEIE